MSHMSRTPGSCKEAQPRKAASSSTATFYEEIYPKLRPFQREAVEFATKGTPYRRFGNKKTTEENNSNSSRRNSRKKSVTKERESQQDELENSSVHDTPLSHQDRSVLGTGRILLSDEMGLGKTVTALAIASYYYAQDVTEWPLLILCPASLRFTWPSEMETFWPRSLNPSHVHVVAGFSDVSWMDRLAPRGPIKIVILTYSLMQQRSAVAQCLLQHAQERNRRQEQLLKNKKQPKPKQKRTSNNNDKMTTQQQDVYFPTIIADESHNLKQRDSQRTQLIVPLLRASQRLLLLSGTPALARPVELFPQLHALAPNLFGPTFKDFADRYCAPQKTWIHARGRKFPKWDYTGASHLEELHTKLQMVMVRRLKQDVLAELPPKQRSVVRVTMSSGEEAKECRQAMKQVRESKQQVRFGDASSWESKQALMQAYQTTGIGKAAAVKDYLLDWLDGSTGKIVVFAHHTKVLDHIESALYRRQGGAGSRSSTSSTSRKGGSTQQPPKSRVAYHIRIDGTVPSNERHALVRQFQTQPQTRVALLSMTAAGVGLTLTAASTVLFAELHWTPGVLAQAEDRVHRLGQRQTSQIVYCLCQDAELSLDPFLCDMLGRKMDTLQKVVDGGGSSALPSQERRTKTSFLSHEANHVAESVDSDEQLESDCPQSGQEEVTHFFANLNNQSQGRNEGKKRVVRGSIESFFLSSSKQQGTKTPTTNVGKNSQTNSTSAGEKLSLNQEAPDVNPTSQLSDTQSLHPMWICEKCTFAENSPQDSKCGICNEPRSLQQKSQKGLSNKDIPSSNIVEWSCASCTFVNRASRSTEDIYQCEMCGEAYSLWQDKPDATNQPESGPALPSTSFVTPTPTRGRKRPCPQSTVSKAGTSNQVISLLESDDDNEENENEFIEVKGSPDVIVIEDSPPPTAKRARPSQAASRIATPRDYAWVFAVSKNTGRISIYHREPEISTNVNFDVHDVLSSESGEDLDSRQSRSLDQKRNLQVSFSDKGVNKICDSVQDDNQGTAARSLTERTQLVSDIKSFVTGYLRLRAVEQQTIKAVGTPFPPHGLSQAVAAATVRNKSSSMHDSQQQAGTSTTERYTGGVKERAYEKQEKGLPLSEEEHNVLDGTACAWCGRRLSRAHQKAEATYCSQECAQEGRLRRGGKFASNHLRTAMFALEGGVCTVCGIDAHALYEQILCLQPAERLNRLLDANWRLPRSCKARDNLFQNPKEGDFWQVDHIQAVAEGGGSCGLDNLRILCVPCHAKETEKLRSRMKLQGPPPNPGGGTLSQSTGTSDSSSSSSGKKRKQIDIRSAFFASKKYG